MIYRTPEELFDGLPGYAFEPHYLEHDGLRMHYVDEGSGAPVLLLHGEPTWSYLYRKTIPPLLEAGRVVAPDYFGFGRSDKPVERDWYSFDRHTESIERLVVLNTGLYSGRPPSDEWLRFREFVRRVGTELRPGQLVRITCVTELPDEVVAAYDAPHPTPESMTGPLMFPELVPTEPDHPSAAAMLEVREAMKRWEGRALVFFSDSDPIFAPRVAERIAELLPNAELQEPVAGAGHFLQEDAGEEVGERIAAWLQTSESV